ncbi:RNA polymerase sigma factor [Bacillus sp. JCM 19046]|nr:RNA polymerase sigma factor [Bacillus sp. JCM 19045]GAF16159.1 RNA polymerase sigma factor [Bacillus sp. JCM 19046]
MKKSSPSAASVERMVDLFLKEPEHKSLYDRAHAQPTNKNKQALDQAFKLFFTKIKVVQYISRLIKGYSIDFDKRTRKRQAFLSIDSNINEEDHSTLDYFIQSADVHTDSVRVNDEQGNTDELFENKLLAKSFKQLDPVQQKVLIYSFYYGYKNKEIAKELAVSEQRISYYKNRALLLLQQSVRS